MPARRRGYSTQQELIEQFEDDIRHEIHKLDELRDADVIIGIPFHAEEDTLPGVVRTARRSLKGMGLSGKSFVLCVGPEDGNGALDAALNVEGEGIEIPVRGFLLQRGIEGRSWTTCAIMKTAAGFKVPLVLLPPDLIPQPEETEREGEGFSPHWISRLLSPVRDHGQDLALAHFSYHPLAHPVESLLTSSFIAGIYGLRLDQPTPGVFALSNDLVQMCVSSADVVSSETGIYGLDPWLVIRAILNRRNVCQVSLGMSSRLHAVESLEPVFRQVTQALFHQAVLYARLWLERPAMIATAGRFGTGLEEMPPAPYEIDEQALFKSFKKEYNRLNDPLIREVVPDTFRQRLEQMVKRSRMNSGLDADEWIEVLRGFLLLYGFEERFHPVDIVAGLFPFFLARLAGFNAEIRSLEKDLNSSRRMTEDAKKALAYRETKQILERQGDLFVHAWTEFRELWYQRESETTSYLPRLGSWEFVPNVGVVVPQEIEKPDGGSIWANQIYQELIDRYRGEFMHFLETSLGGDKTTSSSEILVRVKNFMLELDKTLRDDVYPFNLRTVEGTQTITYQLFDQFAQETKPDGGSTPKMSWQLKPEVAETILKKMPPNNLIMQLGYRNVGELLSEIEPCDALAKSALTDYRQYLDRVLDYIEKNGTDKWFRYAPISPVVTKLKYISIETELGGTESLSFLTGRVLTSRLPIGWGGEFPRIWFLLNVMQNIIGVEMFSSMLEKLLTKDRDCGLRVVTFIRGYWGRHPLSAFNAFENKHHRLLVERLREFAHSLEKAGPDKQKAAHLLLTAAHVYNLSITLPDATFVSLSAWTWAQYGYRGGLGAPTPLSSTVERDWASVDFLSTYLKRAGLGDRKTVEEHATELVRDGRSSENMRPHFLGVAADPDSLIISQATTASSVPAGKLVRLSDKPVLEPIGDHYWESQYVLNAGAVRLEGTIYILYRAFGKDQISRIGLAWTRDGVNIEGRLDHPMLDVAAPSESAGCEDPRMTIIGETMYMLYTAWDRKVPQIAMASIPVQAFLERRFDLWKRDGLGFPGLTNKDAVLYPETFGGLYVVYHRIDPNMWISYLENLSCPWPKSGQKIVIGPRPGMMWDGVKIGAGAPPLKTKYGWLNIYHGVDYERSYRLGVLFMALDDPSKVIYQSPNPILEPETDFELGDEEGREYWVPHVVFTCGAVPAEDKQVLDLDDEILIYYGAADTVIGVAKSTVRDLVPVLNNRG